MESRQDNYRRQKTETEHGIEARQSQKAKKENQHGIEARYLQKVRDRKPKWNRGKIITEANT